jgi:hypothetical protein
MNGTQKFKKVKSRKISRKNKKGGKLFPKGYDPIKGVRNVLTRKEEPVIGQHIGITGVELEKIVKPLKDVEIKMDSIMKDIINLKFDCLNQCLSTASKPINPEENPKDVDERSKQMKEMSKGDTYAWVNLCSTSLRTKECSELLRNIKDMQLYIESIKKLNEKADIYSSQLEKVKEKIDISQLDMNTSF